MSSHEIAKFCMQEILYFQATQDLERVETQQQKEFKSYEMEKEYQHRENLKKLNEEERVKEEQRYKDVKTKHKVHDDMKHPVSPLCPSQISSFCCFSPVVWVFVADSDQVSVSVSDCLFDILCYILFSSSNSLFSLFWLFF